MPASHPSFPPGDGGAFLKAVRQAVDSHLKAHPSSARTTRAMLLKTALMLALTFVPYSLILSGQVTAPALLFGLAALTGLGMAGIGFSVAHDALHGAYSNSPRLNWALGCSMDLAGGSSYLWRITHNIIHHTYTNIHGTDEDLAVSPLLRLSPHAPRAWYHRFQHLYAFALYSMTTLFWAFVKDYKYLLARDLGPYADKKHAPMDVLGLLLGKLVFYTWSMVLPFLLLPYAWWQIAAGILVAHVAAGITLGIVFQLAHVVEETSHPAPTTVGAMPDGWAAHEMYTTANFAPDNRFLGWYVGGLNFQVEHHLFPRVCSMHYPTISPIVKRVAEEHGLPYHSNPTFLGAVRSHLRTLRRFGASDVPHFASTMGTAST